MELSSEMTRKLASAVDKMPAFPRSVQRVLELARDSNGNQRSLVDVINRDPVLTLKVLKIVNSAYYGLSTPITSVGQSVVYLGFNAIKNLALSFAAIGILPKANAAGFNGQQYLLHSLATAEIAKHLAIKVPTVDPMDCFIAGLLHDFGKVVLAQFMPTEFRYALESSQWQESSLHLALRSVIGVDHAFIGAMLAERWRFAPHLVQAIGSQYGPELIDSDVVACVFAANQISKALTFGFAGNVYVEVFPECVVKRLGGTLHEVLVSLGDLKALFEGAKIFARV